MANARLTLEQRVRCVRLFSLTNNVSEVQRRMRTEFGVEPPTRITIVGINNKFNSTGSVLDVKHGAQKSL